MTISSTDIRKEYTGNGVTTAFSYPYYFLANADLKVYLDGTLKTITTHYTVSGAGNPAGGTVTFGTAPATSAVVVIVRDPAITQAVDYVANDPFPAASHETALDRLTMIAQRLNDKLGQSLLVPDDEQFGGQLPSATSRANKYLTFDSNGDPSVSGTNIDDFVTQAAASASNAASSALSAANSASTATDAASTAAGVLSSINTALDDFNDTTASLLPTFQTFSGTGAETAFTLNYAPINEDALDVYISGGYLQKSQYSVSGTTLTFSSAPANGTDNIEVKMAGTVAYQIIGATDFGLIV